MPELWVGTGLPPLGHVSRSVLVIVVLAMSCLSSVRARTRRSLSACASDLPSAKHHLAGLLQETRNRG